MLQTTTTVRKNHEHQSTDHQACRASADQANQGKHFDVIYPIQDLVRGVG